MRQEFQALKGQATAPQLLTTYEAILSQKCSACHSAAVAQKKGGDFILLVDFGSEGLAAWSQWKTVAEAVEAGMRCTSGPCAVVKLIDVLPFECGSR